MVQLIHKVAHLVLQRSDLSVALRQLLFLALKVKRFLVNHPVQLFNLVESLGNLKLEVADVGAQVVALVGLDFVCNVQTINFLQILTVAVPEGGLLVVELALLGLKADISVLTDLHLVLHTLDVHVTVADLLALAVQLRVELGILPLAVVVDRALLVDLGAQRLDEADVCIDSRLVVLVHPALLFVEAAKILLQVNQLILQRLVIALALPQFGRLLHKLCDHALLFGWLGCTTAGSSCVVSAYFCGSVLLGLLLFIRGLLLLLGRLIDLGDVVLLHRGTIVRFCRALRAVSAEWARVARIVADAVLLLLHGARFFLSFGYARSRL